MAGITNYSMCGKRHCGILVMPTSDDVIGVASGCDKKSKLLNARNEGGKEFGIMAAKHGM